MAYRLQPRDLSILEDIGLHGLLDTEMVFASHFEGLSERRCRQVLDGLSSEGLIQTFILATVVQKPIGGKLRPQRQPALHFLTPKGAQLVVEETGRTPHRIMRSRPRPLTLEHRRDIVRVRRAFDAACRTRSMAMPKWIHEGDCYPGIPTNEPLQKRLILHDVFKSEGEVATCKPDVSTLMWLQKDHPLVLYWEIDRSTESNFATKLPGYEALICYQAYRKHWQSLPNDFMLRIMCVCRSPERIRNLSTAIKASPIAGSFRFVLLDDLKPEMIATAAIWLDVAGQSYRIFLAAAA